MLDPAMVVAQARHGPAPPVWQVCYGTRPGSLLLGPQFAALAAFGLAVCGCPLSFTPLGIGGAIFALGVALALVVGGLGAATAALAQAHDWPRAHIARVWRTPSGE